MEKPFSAYTGDEPYVFVSYSHEDAALIYSEIAWLKDQGCNIWYDDGIDAGSLWSEKLAEKISDSSVFLFFATQNSIRSNNCLDEVNFALDANKIMIAVHLDNIELSPGLKLRLNSHQAIKKFELASESYKAKLLACTLNLKVNENSTNAIDNAVVDQKSIAVLPFTNMSNDIEQEYFSDGISEDILNGLVKISDIKVIARTSSFQFKGTNQDIRDIGKRLGVNHVLEGSVRKSGNRVRITAQLIKVSDGTHLWSDRYDRELTDVFGVQDEVTNKILSALDIHLRAEMPVRKEINMDAYQAYLMGKFKRHQSDTEASIEYFSQAIALDPTYEDAYVGLMSMYFDHVLVGNNSKENQQLLEKLGSDLETINPEQPILLVLKAMSLFYIENKYQQALDIFKVLIQMNPNDDSMLNQLVFICNSLGRTDLSLACQRHRLELDPLNGKAQADLGHSLIRSGLYDESAASFERAETLGNPTAFSSSMLAVARGDLQELQKQVDRDARSWTYLQKWHPLVKAHCAFKKKDQKKLDEILSNINQADYSFNDRASICNLQGNITQALVFYSKALESGEIVAYSEIQGRQQYNLLRNAHPDFCDHPGFLQMQAKYSLDQDSISRLEFPTLPF